MPTETFTWLGRIKAVERQYKVVYFAVDFVVQAVNTNPAVLPFEFRQRHLGEAGEHLEATYIIRLFAEFETALRTFLRSQGLRQLPRNADALINRVASRMRSNESILRAHAVREYRNGLVHDRAVDMGPLSIRQATSSLCTFLDPLKSTW